MILKNEIPILEFDTDTSAVIMPTHENLNLNLPKKAVFAAIENIEPKERFLHIDSLQHENYTDIGVFFVT